MILFTAANCPSQWFLQQIDPAVNLFDVRFINKNTGWVCGDNRIFKTTNAGMNWIEQSNPAQALLWQIHPVNENVVYAAGFCTILKTTNGGLNWIALRIGSLPCIGQQFTGLWFINEYTGWIAGEYVTIRTTNGGETFIDSIAINRSMYDIHFRDDSTGVMAGFGATLRSTNSGADWYEVELPHFSKSPDVYRMSFIGNTGWAGTLSNKVYNTLNYGITWDSISFIQPDGPDSRTYCIEFSSQNIGYAGCRGGRIFKTTDGGFSWQLHPTSVYGIPIYRALYAYDDNTVWAVGRGKILYTSNGGLTDIKNTGSINPENINLLQNYPNPFNPITNIKFGINDFSRARIIVSDLTGKTVSVLFKGNLNEGIYEVDFNGNNISSGVYFYSLEINGIIIKTKKMILKK
ncbi:MAG: T9SS type A sorting domain-containing protein [Ignavibacteria bacterium]|nr:T9SS type A sorting domain-containing protein [Ignavibacteria bacterium]